MELGFVGKISSIVIFLLLTSCAMGTEVVNPGDLKKHDTECYQIQLSLPDGWTFTEVGLNEAPPSDAYQDMDPDTLVVALLRDGVSGSLITALYATLPASQDLIEDFITPRHTAEEVQQGIRVEELEQGTVVFVNQIDPPAGSFTLDIYLEASDESGLQHILWIHIMALGTEEEILHVLNEDLNHILEGLDFIPIPCSAAGNF